MRTLHGHTRAVRAVAYAPGRPGLLASAGDDRTVRLWDAPAGEALAAHPGHGDSLLSLAFAPSGRALASGGRTGSLALWEIGDGLATAGPPSFVSRGPAVALAVTPGGVLSVHCTNHYGLPTGVWRWSPGPGPRVAILEPLRDAESAAFSPDARRVAVADLHRALTVWEVGGPRPGPLTRFAARARCLAFAPGGEALAAGTGRFIECWDAGAGARQVVCAGHTSDVLAVAYSPDGRWLLSGGADRTVRLWDAVSARQVAAWDWKLGRVHAVAFAPDGSTAAAGGDKAHVVVWDMDEGT